MHFISIRLLIVLFSVLVLAACSVKQAEIPYTTGWSLDQALAEYAKITSIQAVMALEYEKKDTVMSGDASLTVAPENLSLRIYYLGFLQGEVYEENGEIRAKPRLDRRKSLILVEGLKKGFFWWDMKDAVRTETAETYQLSTADRTVIVSKETLLPVEQTLLFENGEKLLIKYDMPKKSDEKGDANGSPLQWYPSHIVITLQNATVRADISSYTPVR